MITPVHWIIRELSKQTTTLQYQNTCTVPGLPSFTRPSLLTMISLSRYLQLTLSLSLWAVSHITEWSKEKQHVGDFTGL